MQILVNGNETQILMVTPNVPASSAIVSPNINYYNNPKMVTLPNGVQWLFSTIPACNDYDRGIWNGSQYVGSVKGC